MANTLPLRGGHSIVDPSCDVLSLGALSYHIIVNVMDATTIPVSAEENLGDPIDIRVDIIHPDPIAAVAFHAAAVIKTLEAIETITRSQEKRTRMEMERQLASVQESQRQERENLRKL
ncbi:hypothetical protein Tco_0569115 [Tanacetum coccineum]